MPVYGGSKLMWYSRGARRRLRGPLVARRHSAITEADATLVSYPRSGSTWFSFMLADLMLGKDPSFNEAHLAVAELPDARRALHLLPTGGRMLRSHEKWRKQYGRVIYLVRDPRDVVFSYYRYRRWLREYSGSLTDFAVMFVEGEIDSYGRWDTHVESWLNAPSATTLVLKFEDLVADPIAALGQAATFLDLHCADEAITRAVRDTRLSKMRQKEESALPEHFRRTDSSVGGFIGQGRTAVWQGSSSDAAALELVSRTMRPTMMKLEYLGAERS
jgi:Sulfotransferase domain